MQTWQMVVVALVAVGCVGGMSFTLVRMFTSKAAAPAVLREATAFESATVGAVGPAGAKAYEAYSYRVPGRFAGRVRVVVADGTVSIAGPRVPAVLYQVWIWLQALLLALVPAAVVATLFKLEWRWVWATLGLVFVWWLVSCAGAVAFPGIGELDWLAKGRFKAVEFPLDAVRDVKLGKGWSDGGIDVVLLPIKGGIDAMSEGHAVSFSAPDDNGLLVRYAVSLPATADAQELAGVLRR